jgi:chromosome segregation ATPase
LGLGSAHLKKSAMKQPNARPAGKPHAATRNLNSPRGRILDLDDDIFLPADPRPVVRQPAPVSAPRVDGFSTTARTARSEIADSAPIEPPRAKAGASAAEIRVGRLEKTIEEQSQKLSSCHDQILDLSNQRDQQAHDLQSARQAIEALEQSLMALRGVASKRDSELAATIEKLNVSEKERLASQTQVHATHRDYMHVADKLLVAETTLNDQSVIAAAAQETLDRSNAELELFRFQCVALESELKSTQEQRSELREQAAQLRNELGEKVVQLQSQFGEREAQLRSQLGEQEAQIRNELGEKVVQLQSQFGEREAQLRSQLGEQEAQLRHEFGETVGQLQNQFGQHETQLRSQFGEREAQLRSELGEQEARFRSEFGEREAQLRSQFVQQEAQLRSQLSEQEAQFRSEFGEQATRFRREIEVAKAAGQESIRHAAALAQDRAALHQRCEELSRTVNLLQAARRKISSELQINAGDLGQLYADLSEMKASHDSIASKFEHAESKLNVMRLHVEKLETSHAILARYDTALVETAAAKGSTPEQPRQLLKSKNEIFDLLETYFENRSDSSRQVTSRQEAISNQDLVSSQDLLSSEEVVSSQKVLQTNDRLPAELQDRIQEQQPLDTSRDRIPPAGLEFAEWSFTSRDEQGADIIKLETAARGKKVA